MRAAKQSVEVLLLYTVTTDAQYLLKDADVLQISRIINETNEMYGVVL